MVGAAPLDAKLAEGPPGGRAAWLRADDGVRLRAALWPDGRRGTVLIFPGRTEFVEKYGRTAAALATRGLAVAAVDWRGQGLADRLADDLNLGHVASFADYARDVAAFTDWLVAEGAPRPWFLLAHSMGGAIGLRALNAGLPVAAAAFTGPMWGIRVPPVLRPMAGLMARASGRLGFKLRYTPGSGPQNYVFQNGFSGNELTSDRESFDWMAAQMRAHPEMTIGGPSFGWFDAALGEMAALHRLPPPPCPVLVWLGAEERIVDAAAVRRLAARWTGAQVKILAGARHEVLMEGPDTRARVIAETVSFFNRAAQRA